MITCEAGPFLPDRVSALRAWDTRLNVLSERLLYAHKHS